MRNRPPAEVAYHDLTFSPDANFIYYVRQAVGDDLRRLYRVSAFGGTPERLLDDVRAVRVSPDGTRLAFLRSGPSGESQLFVAAIGGMGEHCVLTRKLPDRFLSVAWSSDGRSLATIVFQPGPNYRSGHLHLIDPLTGSDRELGRLPIAAEPGRLTWLRDGFLLKA